MKQTVDSLCRYLVGVFDRKKHTLEVHDSDLYTLRPTVKRMRADAERKKDEGELTNYQRYTQVCFDQ